MPTASACVLGAAIVVFLVGSALCGLAPSMPALIVSRAVQGIGAGGLIPMSTAITATMVPLRERGKFDGFIGAGLLGRIDRGAARRRSLRRPCELALDLLRERPARGDRAGCGAERGAEAQRAPSHTGSTGSARRFSASRPRASCSALSGAGGAPSGGVPLSSSPSPQRWRSSVVFVLVERRAPEPIVPLGLVRTRRIGAEPRLRLPRRVRHVRDDRVPAALHPGSDSVRRRRCRASR